MLRDDKHRDLLRKAGLQLLAGKTIDEIMKHEIFGKTMTECDAFFAKIRGEAQKIMLIDGYVFIPPEKNNPFYLLDKSIKPIYFDAARLAEKIEESKHFKEVHGLEGMRSQYFFAESLQQSAHELITKMEAVKLDQRFHIFLHELQQSVKEDLALYTTWKSSPHVFANEAVQSALACFQFKLMLPDVLKQDQRLFATKAIPEVVKIFCLKVSEAIKENRDPEVIIKAFLQTEEKDDLLMLFQSILREKLKMLPNLRTKDFN